MTNTPTPHLSTVRPTGRDKPTRSVTFWGLMSVAALLVATLVVLSLVLSTRAQTATDSASQNAAQVSAVKATAAPLAGQVQSVCAGGGQAAQQLTVVGACTQAQKVQSAVAVPGPSGPPGPGPSQAEIDGAVNRYFDAHPLPAGQLPPVTEVAGLVAQYLQANPPAAGQNASPQMVADAVMNYCDGHNGCAGPAGQNATDTQVATAVANFCAAHDGCRGPQGAAGQDGVNGKDGANGTNGKPPATYTVLVPAVVGPPTTETCTRTNTDDSNPSYACA